MAAKTFLAYFEKTEDAREAMRFLRQNGYTVTLDMVDGNFPDPDLSVSALMVGILPDFAHIFSDAVNNFARHEQQGAYLLVVAEEARHKDPRHIEEAKKAVIRFGGKPVDREE